MRRRQKIVDTIMNEWESDAMCPRPEFSGGFSITLAGVEISNPQAILKYQRFKLEERIPQVETLKTCEDFKHLNAKCCESCHWHYEIYEMHVVLLPEGGYAWVCCALDRAIRPERAAQRDLQFVQRFRKTAKGRQLLETFGYSKTATGWEKPKEDERADQEGNS